MSAAIRICMGGRVPGHVDAVPAFVETLIGELAEEVERQGWQGVTFTRFSSIDGFLSFDAEEGALPPTAERLRTFREDQKAARERRPEQGSLL